MLNIGKSTQSLNIVKDPFSASKITSINLSYSRVMFEEYFSWTCYIYFTNGNTTGSQKFEVTDKESEDSFGDITKQVQTFVNSLK